MDVVTDSTTSVRLAETMDHVCENHEPMIITRNGQHSVVVMSLEDYKSLEETSYMLRNPKIAGRLLESIADLESGKRASKSLRE